MSDTSCTTYHQAAFQAQECKDALRAAAVLSAYDHDSGADAHRNSAITSLRKAADALGFILLPKETDHSDKATTAHPSAVVAGSGRP